MRSEASPRQAGPREASSASLRVGGAAADVLSVALLTIAHGLYCLLLLLWIHGRDGVTEAEEWRLFVEGWGIAPGFAAASTFVAARALARWVGDWRTWIKYLALLNAMATLLAVAGLRLCTPIGPCLAQRALVTLAAFPILNFAAIVGLHRWVTHHAQQRPRSAHAAWVLPVALGTLALAVIAASLWQPPSASELLGIGLVAVGAAAAPRLWPRPHAAWAVRLGDASVLVGLALFVFDPHLHIEPTHHNWYL